MAPSPVWLYFEKIDNGTKAKCTRCKQVFKYNKSTTTLLNHLNTVHKVKHQKENEQDKEKPISEEVVEAIAPLNRSFESMSAFTANGVKHKLMLDALTYMVVKDGMPLRTPQKPGFKLFCKKLQPLYHPPSIITLTKNLNVKYSDIAEKIKKELQYAESVCLTTDLWTHKYTMQSYLGLTAHYLRETMIKTVELGAYPMDERKTIECLRIKLRDICNNWGLSDEKISAIVSDGGPNIKGAIRQEFGESRHISCFGHTINNIGQRVIEINFPVATANVVELLDSSEDGDILDDSNDNSEDIEISSLRKLLRKVKVIVRFFKSSEVATKELKALQTECGENQYLKLIQECRTRWNSCYEMVDRFILLSDHVGRVLLKLQRQRSTRSKPPNMLTGDDIEALTEVRDILKPLWNITTEVSAEKNVTLSKCIPLIVGLRMKINAFEPLTVTGKITLC